MRSWVVIAAVGAFALAGCSNDTVVTASTSSSPASTTDDPHKAFDPCTDLDTAFVAEEELNALPPKPIENTVGDIRWQGCNFSARAGWGVIIETTNATIEMVRDRGFVNYLDLTIAGRKVLRYDGAADSPPGGCVVNIEMKGGSLEVEVDDPKTENQHHLQPCDLVTYLAEKIVPMLPSSSGN